MRGSQEKKVKEGKGNWGELSIETNPEMWGNMA